LSILILTLNLLLREHGVPLVARFFVALSAGIAYGFGVVSWERRKARARQRMSSASG
jgi:hypothetical protein